MIIMLDMDGVLCDFVGAVMRLHGREFNASDWPRGCWNIHDVLGIPEAVMWERIDAVGPFFWSNLNSYQWAWDLVHAIERSNYNFRICTSPHNSVHSYHGKAVWLERYGLLSGTVFCHHKHLMAGPDRVLIDDSQDNCASFERAGGKALLFPQPWNHSELTVDEVISTVARRTL